MPETIWTEIQALLELDLQDQDPGAGAMALRTVVIYVFTLAIVRLGSRRLLAKPSAFDVIVAIMVGSIMSRAINGTAAFVPTMLAGIVLVVMHWVLASLALRMHWISATVKGTRIPLIRKGEVLREGMRKASITDDDLAEALRLQIHDDDPSKVEVAYMERSGPDQRDPAKRESVARTSRRVKGLI